MSRRAEQFLEPKLHFSEEVDVGAPTTSQTPYVFSKVFTTRQTDRWRSAF